MTARSLVRTVLILLGMATASRSHSATSGNATHFPRRLSVSASGNGEFIFDRKMEEVEDGTHHSLDSTGFYIECSFAPLQDVALDARLGLAEFALDRISQGDGIGTEMQFDPGFFYGLGLRGKVIEIPVIDTWVGLGANYDHFAPDETSVSGLIFEGEADAWDISVDLSRALKEFGAGWEDCTVYGGMRLSHSKINYWHGPTVIQHGAFESENMFGMVLGSEYTVWERFNGHMEFRFLDELALVLSLGFVF